MAKSKTALPKIAQKRLAPYIERGITNGIFTDGKPVAEMYQRKTNDPTLAQTISELGGMSSEPAQQFITETVLVDLSAILRQKRYTGHLDIWEVNHRIVGVASGNPRPVCFITGMAVVEDDDVESEPSLFKLSLWDSDAALADDVERDGKYALAVTCKNLDADILDLRPMQGLASFAQEEYEHGNREELLRGLFDVTDIADLEDNLSVGNNDYRLIEASVSYAGVQNSRAGNQFGKMLLKDDSTMTMDAIESGENLLLNCMCPTAIATRFGKYSKVLALVTVKSSNDYGLSANMDCAIGLVTVAPPEPETPKGGDDDDDDAASYFKTNVPTISADDDDDEEDVPVEPKVKVEEPATAIVEEEIVEDVVETPAPKAAKKAEKAAEPAKDDDDDWDDWD